MRGRGEVAGPVADHGVIAASNSCAKKQAATYSDVEFKALEAAADALEDAADAAETNTVKES